MDKESVIKTKNVDSNSKGMAEAHDKFSGAKQYDHDTLEKFGVEEVKGSGTESQDSKAKLVARVHTDSGYGFYDSHGKLALPEEYQLLKNDIYPDNKEFEYNFYQKEEDGIKHLYYIDVDGAAYLGKGVDAIPLREDLIAVKRDSDYPYYCVIDKSGKIVLGDDQYGKILGISKDDCLLCEIGTNVFSIVTFDGKTYDDKTGFADYSINPKSSLICGFDDDTDTFSYWRCPTDNRHECHLDSDAIPVVYDNWVLGEVPNVGRKRHRLLMSNHSLDICGRDFLGSVVKVSSWKNNIVCYYDDSGTDCWKPINSSDYWFEGVPLMASNIGIVWENNDGYKNLTLSERGGNLIEDRILLCDTLLFEKFYLLYNENKTEDFLGVDEDSRTIVLWKLSSADVDKVLELYSCRDDECIEIDTVSSIGDNICVHFTVGKRTRITDHSLIFNKNGDVIFKDHFGVYNYICGPCNGKYYYLKEGDVYWKQAGVREGHQITDNLHAEMLSPLGDTGRFLVVIEGKYQIIDCDGIKLGEPFADFYLPSEEDQDEILPLVWDYILNSLYIPIKNDEGLCGLIDTNGKIIVPCRYTEIEEMESVFKREGVVFF